VVGDQGCSAAGDKDQAVPGLEAHLSPEALPELRGMNPDQCHIPDHSHFLPQPKVPPA